MLVVGLTGNYGMGKSSVLSFFEELGAETTDCDLIVDELLTDRPIISKIGELLGSRVIGEDGMLDRKAVASAVFADEGLRTGLEKLLHPLVFERIDRIIESAAPDEVVVVEVPLLFETDSLQRFDKIVTVYTSEETALERLGRAGVSKDEALARLRNQLPISVKKERSDYLIDNEGTEPETKQQVGSVFRSLIKDMKSGR